LIFIDEINGWILASFSSHFDLYSVLVLVFVAKETNVLASFIILLLKFKAKQIFG
jgi:hypothetical protein